MSGRIMKYSFRRMLWKVYLAQSINSRKEVENLARASKLIIFCIASKDLKDPVRVAALDLGAAIQASGHDPATCHCEMLGTILASDPNPQYVLLSSGDLRDTITKLVQGKG